MSFFKAHIYIYINPCPFSYPLNPIVPIRSNRPFAAALAEAQHGSQAKGLGVEAAKPYRPSTRWSWLSWIGCGSRSIDRSTCSTTLCFEHQYKTLVFLAIGVFPAFGKTSALNAMLEDLWETKGHLQLTERLSQNSFD